MNVYTENSSTGNRTEVSVNKITSADFTTTAGSNYNVIYAIKTSGDNAYKEVRAAFVLNAYGQIEFESNLQEFNVYKGTFSSLNNVSNVNTDVKLKINFGDGLNTVVTCPEVGEDSLPISIENWPIVYQFNSE